MLDAVANVLGILTAAIVAVRFVWKHREAIKDKLGHWYYEVYCFVFRPGMKIRDVPVSVPVVVVGRITVKHNPFTGEDDVSRVDFKTDEARRRHLEYRMSLRRNDAGK